MLERMQIMYQADAPLSGAFDLKRDPRKTSEQAIPFGGTPSEESIVNSYNRITDSFTDHRRDFASSFMLIGMRAISNQIAKFHNVNPGLQVEALDLGCGPGIVTGHYLQKGVSKITGIDNSPNMIAMANELHEPDIRRGKMNFQVASANEQLPFDDQSFNLVVATYTVLHWEDLDQSFKEIHRVLKPGGAFFLLEPHEERNDLYYRNGGSGAFFPDGIWVLEWYEGAEEDGQAVAIPTCYRRNSTINESMQDAGFLNTQIRVPLPDEEITRDFKQLAHKFVQAKRMVLFKGFKQNGHPLVNANDIMEVPQIIGKE